jgi:hypothetical protein
MEKNIIIGTYTLSSDGMSFNYSTPAVLPMETVGKIIFEVVTNEPPSDEKKENIDFDDLLKGVLNVPKQK